MSVLTETELEIRSGDGYQIADVNYPKRIVTVIAMPYEQPTEIVYHGLAVTEVVTRGAFDGVERRAGKIRANRDHDPRQVVGKIVALHPSRSEGLVTEVKIAQTALGEETLELCNDDMLSASVGFGLLRQDDGHGPVYDDAETWERNRTVRRLNRLRLDHLALVSNPAYPGAAVVSVRDARGGPSEPLSRLETLDGTPNLDRLAYDALKAQFDELNRRYPISPG